MRKVDPIDDEVLDALQLTTEELVEREAKLRREDQTFHAIYLLETIVRLRRSEGKADDVVNAAKAAETYLANLDATGLDPAHVQVLEQLRGALTAEHDRAAKRHWRTPALRTATSSDVEERGRQLGLNQAIEQIRRGVAARRTRQEYGERFIAELESLKKRGPKADLETVTFPRMHTHEELMKLQGMPTTPIKQESVRKAVEAIEKAMGARPKIDFPPLVVDVYEATAAFRAIKVHVAVALKSGGGLIATTGGVGEPDEHESRLLAKLFAASPALARAALRALPVLAEAIARGVFPDDDPTDRLAHDALEGALKEAGWL